MPNTSIMEKLFRCFVIALVIGPLPGTVVSANSGPEQTPESLQLIKQDLHGEWRLDTRTDWARFTKIKLQKATVEFSKNWARNQENRSGNRPTEENMGRIRSDLSELLDEVFKQQLTEDDVFTISETNAENVLLITPGIVNLNIYAPDRMRDYIGYSLADSKGNMTLELEVRDAVSGALLARIVDSREDPGKGYMEWTTSGTNQRAARFMFLRWADKLRDLLIEARLTTPQ